MVYFDETDKTAIYNVNEPMVFVEIEHMFDKNKDICTCKDCRRDIAAIVLNQLNPKYHASAEHPYASREHAIPGKKIKLEIERAFSIVAEHPHHL